MAHSAEVPFIIHGNRRALTERQLEEDPDLRRFVERFSASFEPAYDARVWLFIEPNDEGTTSDEG